MQLVGVNADLLLILGILLALNAARDQSEKGVVLADTEVGAGMDVKTLSATIGHVSAANTVNIKYPHKFKVTVKAA